MKRAHLRLPLYLPEGLYGRLRDMRGARSSDSAAAAGLAGDRDVEYTFIAAELPAGPGKAMDFGCGPGLLSLLAAQRGYQVLALDLEPQQFFWTHPSVEFRKADILQEQLSGSHFDVILNCSAVEHVGIASRYGVAKAHANGDGDLIAMGRMRSVLKAGGRMLLTIPCGRDAVFAPLHRVYGAERLPRLLDGFEVAKQVYWCKGAQNRWAMVQHEEALDFTATADYHQVIRCRYALGCFVLVKPRSATRDE
jgi:SAM-dependent methyltransferase